MFLFKYSIWSKLVLNINLKHCFFKIQISQLARQYYRTEWLSALVARKMSKIGSGVVVKVHKKPLSCQKRSPVTLSTCGFQGPLKDDGLCMGRSVNRGFVRRGELGFACPAPGRAGTDEE